MIAGPTFFAPTQGFTCPSYATVTLQLISTPYTAPTGDVLVLQQLPCPYTPPTVS